MVFTLCRNSIGRLIISYHTSNDITLFKPRKNTEITKESFIKDYYCAFVPGRMVRRKDIPKIFSIGFLYCEDIFLLDFLINTTHNTLDSLQGLLSFSKKCYNCRLLE